MDFKQTFFEIFQIEPSFQLDLDRLSLSYRELQKSIHPDRFVQATDQEKRLSAQWTAQRNEAVRTLKAPLPRAIYLLKLQGIEIEHNPTLDPAFLIEQIELREKLEDIESRGDIALPTLEKYKQQIEQLLSDYEQAFADSAATFEWKQAEQTIYKMQFVNKLLVSAIQLEERLLDYWSWTKYTHKRK